MQPIRSGTQARVGIRSSINVADSVHPNATTPPSAALFTKQNQRPGKDACITTWTDRDEAGVSYRVTIYVSIDGVQFWRLGQMNGGAAITSTVPAGGTTDVDRTSILEFYPGLTAFPFVYCEVTGTLAIDEVPNPDVGYTHVEMLAEDV